MSEVPAVQNALTEYAPPAPANLPPGWFMVGWDISVDYAFDYIRGRSICVRAAFAHERGAKADIDLEFRDGQRPDSYEWLYRLLIVAQDVPEGVRADVDGRRW